jgi:hypothetical protein
VAVLPDGDRASVWAQWMRLNTEGCGITKADLRAAVNALDDFLETNAATINSAIPQPARGSLTSAQKARLLAYVALRRWSPTA